MSVVNAATIVSTPEPSAFHVRNLQLEVRFGFVAGGLRDLLAQFFRGTNQTEEQVRHGIVGNDVGSAPAFDLADIQGTGAC